MDCSCAPMLRFFSMASVDATIKRAPNLEPRFLVNFVPVSGSIASPIMHRFGRCFRKQFADPTVGGATGAIRFALRSKVCKAY